MNDMSKKTEFENGAWKCPNCDYRNFENDYITENDAKFETNCGKCDVKALVSFTRYIEETYDAEIIEELPPPANLLYQWGRFYCKECKTNYSLLIQRPNNNPKYCPCCGHQEVDEDDERDESN